MLGNLTVKQIEDRLGLTFSDDHRQALMESHQDKVNDTPLADGKWHCFDIPFMMLCDSAGTAVKFRDIIQQYKITKNVTFQIGWAGSVDQEGKK